MREWILDWRVKRKNERRRIGGLKNRMIENEDENYKMEYDE